MNAALELTDLYVRVENKPIIKNLTLSLLPGCVHVLMGPNGSGKSTLARALAGDPKCFISGGNVFLGKTDISVMRPDERARKGLFLAFQQPCTIPGLTIFSFLKEAYSFCTGKTIDVDEFRQILYKKMSILGIEESFAFRGLHEGFSGGESKRLEMLQLLVLRPRVAILDEIDSGLDVDALKCVALGIEHSRQENQKMAILLITHYQRILRYVQPDHVHVFCNGSITRSGGPELALEVEAKGYHAFR